MFPYTSLLQGMVSRFWGCLSLYCSLRRHVPCTEVLSLQCSTEWDHFIKFWLHPLGPSLGNSTHQDFQIWFSGSNHNLERYKAKVKGLRSCECENEVLHVILEVPKLEFETWCFTFDVMRPNRNDISKVIALPLLLCSYFVCHNLFKFFLLLFY